MTTTFNRHNTKMNTQLEQQATQEPMVQTSMSHEQVELLASSRDNDHIYAAYPKMADTSRFKRKMERERRDKVARFTSMMDRAVALGAYDPSTGYVRFDGVPCSSKADSTCVNASMLRLELERRGVTGVEVAI